MKDDPRIGPARDVPTDRPKLIGSVRLPIPKLVRKNEAEGWKEMTSHVAYDTLGRAWYLIARFQKLQDLGPMRGLGRLTLVRWQFCSDLPFEFTPAGELEDMPPPPFNEGGAALGVLAAETDDDEDQS